MPKGSALPGSWATLIAAAQREKLPVIVDPARMPDYGPYRGAQIIVPPRTGIRGGDRPKCASGKAFSSEFPEAPSPGVDHYGWGESLRRT